MSGRHRGPLRATRPGRRLLFAITAGALALGLSVTGATGALFAQHTPVTAGALTTAQLGLAVGHAGSTAGTSGTDVALSPTAPTAYGAGDLTLVNTGTDGRNPLGYAVSAVSVTGATALAASIAVTWAPASAGTDCALADYQSAPAWSAPSLAMDGSAPTVGGKTAATIDPAGSQRLCARYTLTDANPTGGTVTATFTFAGWNAPSGSFTSNPVSWTQRIAVASNAPKLMHRPIVTNCGKQFTGSIVTSYQFGWYYQTNYSGGWTPDHYRVTWSGTPGNLISAKSPNRSYPVIFDNVGPGQHEINVSYLDQFGYTDIVGTVTIAGVDGAGNPTTEPATIVYYPKDDRSHPACTNTSDR